MELNNLDQSRMVMPHTKTSFISRRKFTSLAKKGKVTVTKYYMIKPLKAKKPPRSASSKLDKPQSDILYELFAKLQLGTLQPNRKVSKSAILDCSKSLTTQLKLNSVESRMVDNRSYQMDSFISTLRQCVLPRVKRECIWI
jgi:hypothetical protein